MRVFGLIGYPLSHSFSKKFFAGKFCSEGIADCTYENFSIPAMGDFEDLIKNTPNLKGLNVTIPYKQQVISHLHEVNEVVKKTGACNCIKFVNGKLKGFNTDTIGFEQSLRKYLLPSHKRAIVLGTGGAAQAIRYVLEKLHIAYISVSRNESSKDNHLTYAQLTNEMISNATLLINTTPLGMYPETDVAPPIDYRMINSSHYLFDLVYNPEKTLFLRKGEEMGAVVQNGYEMLIIQAEESWKIWNS